MVTNLQYKTELISHCIILLEESMKSTMKAMEDAQEEANNYGMPKDRYDGFRNQLMRKKDMLAKQYDQLRINFEMIKKVDLEKVHSTAEFGSLIETDKSKFLICVGMGVIKFKGENIAVISKLVPIFQVMKDKKAGAEFSFNNVNHKILNII